MTDTNYRPRRSCLYMPGGNVRALEKARTLDADVVIFDLEDSVAPESKDQARRCVCDAVASRAYGSREVVVRINPLSSEWGPGDLDAVLDAAPDAILLPKVLLPEDITDCNDLISEIDGAPLGLWAMIESPLAVMNLREIAQTATRTRLSALVVGPNDLAKDMQARVTDGRVAIQTALSLTVMAARAYGIAAIDGVYNDIGNEAGLIAECEQGRSLGFDGKTLIHPSQLEASNRIFSPAAEEVEHARRVIAAFSLPENEGKGVIKVDGKMTELLHLEQAKRLVDLDDAIRARH